LLQLWVLRALQQLQRELQPAQVLVAHAHHLQRQAGRGSNPPTRAAAAGGGPNARAGYKARSACAGPAPSRCNKATPAAPAPTLSSTPFMERRLLFSAPNWPSCRREARVAAAEDCAQGGAQLQAGAERRQAAHAWAPHTAMRERRLTGGSQRACTQLQGMGRGRGPLRTLCVSASICSWSCSSRSFWRCLKRACERGAARGASVGHGRRPGGVLRRAAGQARRSGAQPAVGLPERCGSSRPRPACAESAGRPWRPGSWRGWWPGWAARARRPWWAAAAAARAAAAAGQGHRRPARPSRAAGAPTLLPSPSPRSRGAGQDVLPAACCRRRCLCCWPPQSPARRPEPLTALPAPTSRWRSTFSAVARSQLSGACRWRRGGKQLPRRPHRLVDCRKGDISRRASKMMFE
jgi:hypothetical protein